jgi:hypothetical protein
MTITEIPNNLSNITPIKEIMDVYINGIHENLPHRNGFIYLLIGAPGMGKSSLLLSMFKNNDYYKNKFDNIYLITPLVSFQSVKKHPFALHDKVFHELNIDVLENIYNELIEIKDTCIVEDFPLEKSVLIIDDFASELKNVDLIRMLKQFCIKSRHLGVSLIFTLQSYNLFPLVLRKLVTNVTIFKFKNNKEMELVSSELLNMKKDETIEIFRYIFDKPYNHLDVCITNSEYYKNFNKLIIT